MPIGAGHESHSERCRGLDAVYGVQIAGGLRCLFANGMVSPRRARLIRHSGIWRFSCLRKPGIGTRFPVRSEPLLKGVLRSPRSGAEP